MWVLCVHGVYVRTYMLWVGAVSVVDCVGGCCVYAVGAVGTVCVYTVYAVGTVCTV